ncbi:MAG: protoporphyrinogen/coproporphyrinogen oxidase [Pyrinomonadaceae bacterium]|jgi:oxygen-dependent protoporphyrinogen oxidase|nr:protoporphyrinogen/coproporphyrinogen oxidase [Pyrinomonadaceae bacterium]
MKRVAIIGSGIAGLAAAHRLLERSAETDEPLELLIFESGSRLGGIIKTEARDGFLLEQGPDSFITEKPAAIELARRLGLESQLIQTNETHRRSFIARGTQLIPVPAGFQLIAPTQFWPFVNSEIMSWSGKARMALDLVLPRLKTNGATDESLAQFVRRRLGREALERVAQPMIGGIYTADPERLSLQATMPRFIELERKHRSLIRALRKEKGVEPNEVQSQTQGARYSLFASFDRGMQVLSDRLAAKLAATGIALRTRVTAVDLDRTSMHWQVRAEQGLAITVDAVCLAVSAYAAASLLGETDVLLAAGLKQIPYESTATVNLAYRRADIAHPLDGFGFVVPFIEKRSLMACTFSSVKFAGRAPQDSVLLRAFVGGALQAELIDLDETEMLARVRGDLKDLLGIVNAPLFSTISRWPQSMPQYEIGHVARVNKIAERVAKLPGLALAGNAYSGVGIPDCIRSGETAADSLFAALHKNRVIS